MNLTIVHIRNYRLPKHPRVFDVIVDPNGRILSYEMQNIQGAMSINSNEVQRQINVALRKAYKI